MASQTINKTKKENDMFSPNPLIKAMHDQNRIVKAIRADKKLSTVNGIKLVSPI